MTNTGQQLVHLTLWTLLAAVGIVVIARWLHPATFSETTSIVLIVVAFIAAVIHLSNTHHE